MEWLLEKVKVIPVGARGISSVSTKGKERYVLYLPTRLNDLWREIRRSKRKVLVYLKIAD